MIKDLVKLTTRTRTSLTTFITEPVFTIIMITISPLVLGVTIGRLA